MMMTPAGTISPANVFVIGAGVAGLQAIATAKRLGARVEAFDTRPVVEEQVNSLGAKFLKIDLGDMGQTQDGYAQKLTDDQLKKQQELTANACAKADIVITTAQVFGHRAPTIITKEMVAQMKAGSVIVDLAVETGGNVDGTVLNQEVVTDNGVLLVGLANLPGRVAKHASQVYAMNLFNLVKDLYNPETQQLVLVTDHEIVKSALTIHNGKIVHPLLQKVVKNG
jgi:NAD(P) transhydrogenase subunit alpha